MKRRQQRWRTDMFLIHCPYCDERRPEIEFAYGGEAHIARPLDPAGQSDEEIVKAAAKHLKASYARNEMPAPDMECQLLYVIVAVHVRLGEFTEAQSYFGVMDKMKRPPPDGGTDGKGGVPASLERWLDMARDLLADRENPGLWKH